MSFQITNPTDGATIVAGSSVTVTGTGVSDSDIASITFEPESTPSEPGQTPQNPTKFFSKKVQAPTLPGKYVLVVKTGGKSVTVTVEVKVVST